MASPSQSLFLPALPTQEVCVCISTQRWNPGPVAFTPHSPVVKERSKTPASLQGLEPGEGRAQCRATSGQWKRVEALDSSARVFMRDGSQGQGPGDTP